MLPVLIGGICFWMLVVETVAKIRRISVDQADLPGAEGLAMRKVLRSGQTEFRYVIAQRFDKYGLYLCCKAKLCEDIYCV
jgi:hypothetical protein